MHSTTLTASNGHITFPVGTDAEFTARINDLSDESLARYLQLHDPGMVAEARALFADTEEPTR